MQRIIQLFYLICFALFASKAQAQSSKSKIIDPVYPQPKFNGDILSYISAHFHYTDVMKEEGANGRVIVKFIVYRDGSIDSAQIIRSVSPAFDDETIRVIMHMPRWIPASVNGKPISSWYTLPFTLDPDY